MRIFYGTDHLPQFERPVITIGTFDGVHQGHKMILESVVSEAKSLNGTSILITFDPHPRKLIFPDEPLKLLSTLKERQQLVEDAGIDVIVVVPFTTEFSSLSAQHYIDQFLFGFFRPAAIVIGYDHHFGHDRTGDIAMLKVYAASHHFIVKEIPAQLIAEAAVSSTQVRKALQQGDVAKASAMLGTPYCICGIVEKGAQLGRTIGYPTANISIPDKDKLVPKTGVYAVLLSIAGKSYKGMLNLGTNPTVSSNEIIKIEVNIFDFNEDIYGEEINVCFVARLRDEQKFEGLEALKRQLATDREHAMMVLQLH